MVLKEELGFRREVGVEEVVEVFSLFDGSDGPFRVVPFTTLVINGPPMLALLLLLLVVVAVTDVMAPPPGSEGPTLSFSLLKIK